MVEAGLRSVSFRCRGHPDIRASHHKSFEFTRQEHITARATCILGVAADADPGQLAGFRGPVAITVEAGASREEIRAVANPRFESGDRAVVRTSRHAAPETLAVAADKGADQLARTLVEELADPATTVRVTVAEQPARGRPGAGELLVAALPELRSLHITAEIRAALDGADAVLAADPAVVRGVLEAAGVRLPVHAADADGQIRERLRADERLACLAATGARVSAGRTDADAAELVRVAGAAADAKAAIRILPAPPLELAARVTATPEAAPYTLVVPPAADRRARVAALEATAAAGANLVWRADPASVPDALTDVGDIAGDGPARLCVGISSRQGIVLRGTTSEVSRQWDELGRPPGDTVVVLPGKALAGAGTGRLDAALTALLAENVSARTLARALGSLPGRNYRSEYRRVLRLQSDRRPGAG